MDYQIVVVAEDALAAEHGWAMIETDDVTIFAFKESAISPQAMADAWAAYRMIARGPEPARQRPEWMNLLALMPRSA